MAARSLGGVPGRGYRRFPAPVSGHAPRRDAAVYKEFAREAVVWLIPVVILIGLAYLVTSA
ncbi:hypothetical protein GCM10010466_15530 [Planomonospora alba]|uniref:Uncharacterized protein n=1 Tax=Planomonospora alba TaxID=161354 RepID=A0ABP6MUX8_9ACTN